MPHDFRNKSFQKVLRGYAPEEVDEYIAYINEEYRKLERRTADSERKLALALKKLDESAKNGAADPAGPAAREAAEKLLRKTEDECKLRIAAAQDAGMMAAEEMIETAQKEVEQIYKDALEKADGILAKAKTEAEAIRAEAKAEAEEHREDVAKAQKTAQTIYEEIGSFRERLFALYNEHLDMLDNVTDSTQKFMDGVNETAGTKLPEEEKLPEEVMPEEAEESEELEECLPAEEPLPEEPEFFVETEEPEVTDLPDEEDFREDPGDLAELEEEFAEEPEIDSEREDVASNLAFMDRLFASIQAEEAVEGEDLYIDLADEEFEEESADGAEEESYEDCDTEPEEEPLEEELPSFMIDWRNRSAVSAEEEDGASEDDFRSVDEFDDFEEEPDAFEEENYDDYLPEELPGEEEAFAEEEEEEDEETEEQEKDEFHDMDQIFNEDKSKREMSLTDEFNIIFSDSKSSQNVKEISRQPIVAPEDPKAAKKHKKY